MNIIASVLATGLTSLAPYLSETPHPRILMTDADKAQITAAIQSSPYLQDVEKTVYSIADQAVTDRPTWYEKEGKRLLDKSRRSLRNLFSLSYAYRFSHEAKYLEAACRELNSVCSFNDWNPSHYLDVGEMCMGVSIAYDWLYQDLPDSIKTKVEDAIERCAFDTALTPKTPWFYTNTYNWNQVCNAGLVYGAFAIGDKTPEKAEKILAKCYETIHLPVDNYDPDGAYPEGPTYWGYGTMFNAMLNYQLEKAGMEWYRGKGGFENTGDYYVQSQGTSGYYYNYSDCGISRQPNIAIFYFAYLKNDPGLLCSIVKNPVYRDRLLPAVLLFAKDLDMSETANPSQLTWLGHGTTPAYFARTSWTDPDALFFGVKGGKAYTSHGHQDQGSFVFDALGERWSADLGCEEYYNIEKEGVDLWNMMQESDRWDLLAYNNMHHSTLTIGGRHQNVLGKAEIVKEYSSRGKKGVDVDMTPCYDNADTVLRTIYLSKGKCLEIFDRIQLKADSCEAGRLQLDWNLITGMDTECEVKGEGIVLMHRNGKTVEVKLDAPKNVRFETVVEDCVPETSYEEKKGRRIRFSANMIGREQYRIHVTLTPLKN